MESVSCSEEPAVRVLSLWGKRVEQWNPKTCRLCPGAAQKVYRVCVDSIAFNDRNVNLDANKTLFTEANSGLG